MNKKIWYVIGFSLSWALLIFVNKMAMNVGVEGFSYTVQTQLISVLLLLIYNLFLHKKELKQLKSKQLMRMGVIGLVVGTAIMCGFYGLQLSTSVNYGFLIKSTLLFTTVLAYFFLGEKFSPKKWFLLAFFVLGIYLLSTGGKRIIPRVGDLLTLTAAVGFSSALILTKPLTRKVDSDIISLGRTSFSFFAVLLASLVIGINVFTVVSPVFLILAGVFGAILPIFLNKTITVSSASYLTMMSMMVPVMVTVLGFVFLREPVNLFQIIGGSLIIVSGVLVEKCKI